MSCLVDFATLNWVSIALAALATHMFSVIWHAVLFSSLWEYYTAADKGVKQAKHMKIRYSFVTQLTLAVVKAVAFATAIASIVQLIPAAKQTQCGYNCIALIMSIFSVFTEVGSVWSQRPLPLIILNSAHSIGFAVLGAYVLFHTKDIKIA